MAQGTPTRKKGGRAIASRTRTRRTSGRIASAVFALVIASLLVTAWPVAGRPEAVKVTSGAWATHAVALTFDDGYKRSACASIARTLRAHGAIGTFFVNGIHLASAPSAWRDILAGQQVGNHTRSHLRLTKQSEQVVRRQIVQNEALHERILGRPMLKVLRPPYGAHDARIRGIAGELGYRYTVLWSVDSRDWQRSATVRSIIDRATDAPPGSIILMHCGPRETPLALARIIRHYQARGITLAGLDVVLRGLAAQAPSTDL
jgi:peptidoglycan/xylan/chitin deacetylase (PgdA/CDA1 family)